MMEWPNQQNYSLKKKKNSIRLHIIFLPLIFSINFSLLYKTF